MAQELPPFRKFEPLSEVFKDKFILFCLLMVFLSILDLKSCSPGASYIIRLQFKIRGIDPAHHSFILTSVFGHFNSIAALARVIDKASTVFFSIYSGFNLVRGFIQSIFNKPLL